MTSVVCGFQPDMAHPQGDCRGGQPLTGVKLSLWQNTNDVREPVADWVAEDTPVTVGA